MIFFLYYLVFHVYFINLLRFKLFILQQLEVFTLHYFMCSHKELNLDCIGERPDCYQLSQPYSVYFIVPSPTHTCRDTFSCCTFCRDGQMDVSVCLHFPVVPLAETKWNFLLMISPEPTCPYSVLLYLRSGQLQIWIRKFFYLNDIKFMHFADSHQGLGLVYILKCSFTLISTTDSLYS